MKLSRTLYTFLLLQLLAGLAVFPGKGYADEAVRPESGRVEDPAAGARERWNRLSEAEKARLRENFRRWKEMSESERTQLKEKYRRFQALTPEKKDRVIGLFKRFKALPEERQKQIRQRYVQLMRMAPEERKERLDSLRQRIRDRNESRGPHGSGGDSDRRRGSRR